MAHKNNDKEAFGGQYVLGDKLNNGNGFDMNSQDNDSKTNPDLYDSTKRNLAHLTIKQIISAYHKHNTNNTMDENTDTHNLLVDGKNINQVLLFGTAISINHEYTHSVVMLHDYTGRIPIKFWNPSENLEMADKLKNLRYDTYNALSQRSELIL